MRFPKTPILWLALILVSLLGVHAMAEPITIQLWHGITGGDYRALEEIIRKFNREYGESIQVEDSQMTWNEYYDKLHISLAAGSPPDVGIIHVNRLSELVAKNMLRPVDDLWNEAGWTEDTFIPGVAAGARYDNTYYAVPLDIYTNVLFYNVDHLQEAGIDTPPTDPEEYVSQARKLTRRVNDTVVRWGTNAAGDLGRFYTILWQYGGDIYAEDRMTVNLDTPEAEAAMQFVWNLIFEHQAAPYAPHIPDMWRGEISLVTQGFHNQIRAHQMRADGIVNLQVAPIDRLFGSDRPGVMIGSHQLVRLRTLDQDPERTAAVNTFLQYVSDHNIIWAEYGNLPVRVSAVQDPLFGGLENHQRIIHQTFVYLPRPPWGTGQAELDPMLRVAFDPTHPSHTSIRNALAQGAERMNATVKNYLQ